jgi:uncharacterized protein (DUF2141 family)
MLLLSAIIVLISSCANETALTGGPKDITPPKVLKSTPENFSVNFNSNIVVFEFDEYIKLNNVKQKLMVSPPLDKDPDISQKGKKVTMKLNAPLMENVTYNFFFDDAIVDYNEGNALKNFSYIVSTGESLDSLSLEGRLRDSYTFKPVENSLVMLHADLSDSSFIKNKPYYITKTDKDGFFHFTHLKDTTYKIFALKDLNNSYTFDLITEDIAFYDSAFKLSYDTLIHINLLSFQEIDTVQKVIEKKATQLNTMQLIFKFPPQEPRIEFYNTLPETRHIIFSNNKDTLTVFTSGIDTVFCTVYDKEQFIDSVRIIVNNQRLVKSSALKVTPEFGNKVFYKDELFLDFNNFIKEVLCDTLKVVTNIDTIFDTTFVRMHLLEPENISAKIDLNLDIEKKYQLFIPDSAFLDINENYNKKINSQFSVVDENAFGNLILKFKKVFRVQVPNSESDSVFIEDSIIDISDSLYIEPKIQVPDTLSYELEIMNTELQQDSLHYDHDHGHNCDHDHHDEKKAINKTKIYLPIDTIPNCNTFFIELMDGKKAVVAYERFTLHENDSVTLMFKMLVPGEYSLRIVYDIDDNGKWTTGNYSGRYQPEKIIYPKNVTVIGKWDVEEVIEIW